MTNGRDRQDPGTPGRRETRTIGEESRAPWRPDDPDLHEAGDDGPHGTAPTDVGPTRDSGRDDAGDPDDPDDARDRPRP